MSGSLRLHPTLGVNPCMEVCFWCRGDTGSILLLGANGGRPAPRKAYGSYKFCDKCDVIVKSGIAMIEVVNGPIHEGQEPIVAREFPVQSGFYPTGRMVVVRREWGEVNLADLVGVDLAVEILAKGSTLVDTETFNRLGLAGPGANETKQ